jgi:hypothetical protein
MRTYLIPSLGVCQLTVEDVVATKLLICILEVVISVSITSSIIGLRQHALQRSERCSRYR